MKFNKLPPAGGEFKSVSVHFDQPFLRSFSMESGYQSAQQVMGDAVLYLEPHPLV